MSEWRYRSILIVSAADRAAGDDVATTVVGEDQSGTFSVELSADGSAPATHYGCCSLVTAVMLLAMRDALLAGSLPSLIYYRLDAATDELLASSSETAEIGSVMTWQQAIEDAGLQVVNDEGTE